MNPRAGPDGLFSLDGKTALVTGGSRGLGAAIVECFVMAGARVAFCHHQDAAAAKSLEARLANFPVFSMECDVASEVQVERLRAWITQTLGEVDIVVSAAGIGGSAAFLELDAEAFDRMIAVNLRGPFLVARAFLGSMMARRSGRVINVSSQLAYSGAPLLAHYCASKAGLIGLTKALAQEAAPFGVLVNAVAPGPFDSQMLMGLPEKWRADKKKELPIGRFAAAEEIVPTVLLLASEAGSYYVGQTLSPNGGDVML